MRARISRPCRYQLAAIKTHPELTEEAEMTPIEAVFAVIIFYVGLLAGRMGERMRSYRLGAPSIYDQQNRSMEAQQRAVFNFESHETGYCTSQTQNMRIVVREALNASA